MLKKIEYFSLLIFCLEAKQYVFNRFDNSVAPATLALNSSRLSSAKRRWFTAGAVGATLIPLRYDKIELDFRRHGRPSTTIKKRYGEIGSPCLTPRVG